MSQRAKPGSRRIIQYLSAAVMRVGGIEAKCPGSLTIDDKLEISRLFDWQNPLCSFEDPSNIDTGRPIQGRETGSITDETADATMQPAPQDNQLMSSTALSASSRNFDLNGEDRTASTKQNSPLLRQLRRFHHVINSAKVFGTHKHRKPQGFDRRQFLRVPPIRLPGRLRFHGDCETRAVRSIRCRGPSPRHSDQATCDLSVGYDTR
jgi:hypothetical protein